MILDDRLKQLKTPFYYFNREHLKRQVDLMTQAFTTYWDNYIIGYSVKTNSLPAIAKQLKDWGVTAEVVSQDEYNMVRHLGYDHAHIVCNGPIKEPEWLDEIIAHQVLINMDSQAEIDYFVQKAQEYPTITYRCGIRVNLDAESAFGEEINTDSMGSRFGFSYEKGTLKEVIDQLQAQDNIQIEGLHMHLNSNTRSLAIYEWLSDKFVQIVQEYQLKDISYFDIGGGFYGDVPTKPDWNAYIQTIASVLCKGGFAPQSLKLIIEPGVSLLAGSLQYITKVVDIKENAVSAIATLDGSRIHIDPFFHKRKQQYFYQIEKTVESQLISYTDAQIVGFTCLERDRFFVESAAVAVGDLFVFDKVGAYTLTMAPLFIMYYPAVYSLNELGEVECVRSKWTAKEFLQQSKI